MFVQDRFLYLIMARHKLTVWLEYAHAVSNLILFFLLLMYLLIIVMLE
jgi:hypothetical protein